MLIEKALSVKDGVFSQGRGDMMKKWIAAAVLAAALGAGGAAYADDLHLPGGGVLPLGPAVTVWDGSHSYLSGKIGELLASPEVTESMAEGFIQQGLYKESEKKEALALAESLMQIARSSRMYQLRSVHGNTMYTAAVLSVPITLPAAGDLQRELLARAAAYEKKMGHEKEAEALAAHGEFSGLWHWAEGLMKDADTGRGTTPAGIPYEMVRLRTSYEYGNYTVPLYVYSLSQTRAGQMVVTIFWADQASGRYLEPYLKKAAEEAR